MSDPWQGTAVQVLTALMIFTLGLPAFLFQVIVPSDVKEVIRRNKWLIGWQLAVVLCLFSAALLAVLVGAGEHGPLSGTSLRLGLWAITTVTVVFWWSESSQDLRSRVLFRLKKRSLRRIGSAGQIDSRVIEDLVVLGRGKVLGGERTKIVLAFGDLIETAQNSIHYSGRVLDDVIDGLEQVLRYEELEEAGGESLKSGAEVLRAVVMRARKKFPRERPDEGRARRAAGRLCQVAVEQGLDGAAITFLEGGGVRGRDLVRVARVAVESGNFLILSACANRAGKLFGRAGRRRNDDAGAYCGVLAMLWFSCRGGKDRVRERLAVSGASNKEEEADSLLRFGCRRLREWAEDGIGDQCEAMSKELRHAASGGE